MMKLTIKSLARGAAFLLVGCNNSDNELPAIPEKPSSVSVKVLHAVSDAPYVSVSRINGVVIPNLTFVPFKADSGYIQVPAGDYFVTFTPTGSKTAAIGPVAVTIDANNIYTAVARDGVGLTADLGLILLDDFNNMQ